MRVVVTGSADFIGQHTRRALEDRQIEVVTADLKTGTDLSTEVERWHPRPDAIIHLASSCSTLGSIRDPMETFRNTVLTAVNVLEVARQDEIPVILTSSVKARDGMTPYGSAKRMVEQWAREYGIAYRLPIVINRPGTVYGPGQEGSPESGWIAWFCKARDENQPIVINGDGRQVRDLLHVSDYVRLMLIQLDSLVAGHGDYHVREGIWDVGGGPLNKTTVYDMAMHLGLAFSFGPRRYGDAEEYVGINDVPGWEPLVQWRESEELQEKPDQARYVHV